MTEHVRAGKMKIADFYRSGELHASLRGPLHDHGDGVDHGQHGGSARHGPAGQCGDTRRRFSAQYAGSRLGGGSSKWCTRICGFRAS